MILKEILLVEANVEPEGLQYIDDWIGEIKDSIEKGNPGFNHDPFMKRLRKDIINDAMGRSNLLPDDAMLQIYKTPGDPAAPGKETDPDWVKNATEIVWTVDQKSFSKLEDEITSLFFAHDDLNKQGTFNRFHQLVQTEKLNIKNNAKGWSTMYNRPMEPDDPQEEHIYDEALRKIGPLTKKYEQGKYNLEGLQKALLFLSGSGAQAWKTNPKERERLEKEAPIIMKFDDGFMWVRLDSVAEFEREGDMLQNCLHGYCPPSEGATGEGTGESRDAVYQAWKDAGKPLDKEALQHEKDGNHILQFWYWGDAEEGTEVSEPLNPNTRRLMKWTEAARKKLYPDADEAWFENDQPFGWKLGADMDGQAFGKYENIDHYMAHHIINYEYLAADPADPDHEPDEWDREAVPAEQSGSLVYSLRDRNGNSHVAIEYDVKKEKPFQLDVKGKQNAEPDEKYNKYISALDKHWKENPDTFGSKTDEGIERLKHLAGLSEGAIWDKVKASTNKLTNTIWDTMANLKNDYSPEQIKQKWIELKQAITQEKTETKEMWAIYEKWLQCDIDRNVTPEEEPNCPTSDEIVVANQQMKDLLKASGLAILFALPIPGGALLVAGVIKVGAKFGVQLVPSAFQTPVSQLTQGESIQRIKHLAGI
jgi:hypothetical protein